MNRLTRRVFLGKGIAGAAGALAVPKLFSSAGAEAGNRNFICRTLGKTKIKVPVVGLGIIRADNPGLCKAAYEAGIKLFDITGGYKYGNGRRMSGSLFRDMPGDSFVTGIKVKPAGVQGNGLPSSRTTSEDFLVKFNESLSQFKLDNVDLLFIQDVSNPELLEYKPLLKAVQNLKRKKRTRFIGFSTQSNMADVINAAAGSDIWDVVQASYNFVVGDDPGIEAALNNANNSGLGIIAIDTLAGGLFLDKEKTMPVSSAAALKWVLSNENVHAALPGITTADQLALCLPVLGDVVLTDQDRQGLITAGSKPNICCTGCAKCISDCRGKLPIPGLMRAYMYAYGYSDIPQAYSLLGELGAGSHPCINCTDCVASCQKGFRLKEKISDVSRLVNMPADFIV